MPGNRWVKLKPLRNSLFFTVEDISRVLGIKIDSARVFCSRRSKNGMFLKLKNNFYVFSEKWDDYDAKDKFGIANVLQVPSYVSLMSALEYYELTTQIRRDSIESVSVKRTFRRSIGESDFLYFKINERFYFGFNKIENFFIASPEKAFLDCIYLYSFGKYKMDFASIDFKKLGKGKIFLMLKRYPEKTRKIVKQYAGF